MTPPDSNSETTKVDNMNQIDISKFLQKNTFYYVVGIVNYYLSELNFSKIKSYFEIYKNKRVKIHLKYSHY